MKKSLRSRFAAGMCSLSFLMHFSEIMPTVKAIDLSPGTSSTIITAEETSMIETQPTQTSFVSATATTTTESIVFTKGSVQLTLNDVVALSQKGTALDWADFTDYISTDIGSGIFIDKYDLENGYTLLVGGVPPQSPNYILLYRDDDRTNGIDIRTNDVKTFLDGTTTSVPITPPETTTQSKETNSSTTISTLVTTTIPVVTTYTISEPKSSELYGLAIETPEIVLNVGESQKLKVQIDTEYYHPESLVFVSDSAKIVSVSPDGTVKAVSEGTAHIQVSIKLTDEKAEILAVDTPVRSVTATITVIDNTLTDEQKAALKILEQKENSLFTEFKRERAVIRGELAPDAPRLTRDEVNRIIESSDSMSDVFRNISEVQEYPDSVGGSGVLRIEYWFDDCGTEKILITAEQQDIVYIHFNPDGSINEWCFLLHSTQSNEQPFQTVSITQLYTIFNDIPNGDINGDNMVTVSDAILAARIVAEDITVSVTTEGMKQADMNGSGATDQDDIVLILKKIAGIK